MLFLKSLQDLADKLQDEKGQLQAIKCDLTKEPDIMSMFDQIKKQFGKLDVCINNAGMAKPARLLSGATEDWQAMLDVGQILEFRNNQIISNSVTYNSKNTTGM